MADEFFPLWHLPNLEFFFDWIKKTKSHHSGCMDHTMTVDQNICRRMVNSILLKPHWRWGPENKGKECFFSVAVSKLFHIHAEIFPQMILDVLCIKFTSSAAAWIWYRGTWTNGPWLTLYKHVLSIRKREESFFPPLASWETSMSRQPRLNMSIQGALQPTLHESMQTNRWLTELSSSDTVSLPALLHQCAWTRGQVWICLLRPRQPNVKGWCCEFVAASLYLLKMEKWY